MLALLAAPLLPLGQDPSEPRAIDVIAVPGHYSKEEKAAAAFESAARERLVNGYLSATAKAIGTTDAPVLIVWPETAVPVFAERDHWLRKGFERTALPGGAIVLTGAFALADAGFYLPTRHRALQYLDQCLQAAALPDRDQLLRMLLPTSRSS